MTDETEVLWIKREALEDVAQRNRLDDRVIDAVWNAVEEALNAGWTFKRLERQVRCEWVDTHKDKAREAAREVGA